MSICPDLLMKVWTDWGLAQGSTQAPVLSNNVCYECGGTEFTRYTDSSHEKACKCGVTKNDVGAFVSVEGSNYEDGTDNRQHQRGPDRGAGNAVPFAGKEAVKATADITAQSEVVRKATDIWENFTVAERNQLKALVVPVTLTQSGTRDGSRPRKLLKTFLGRIAKGVRDTNKIRNRLVEWATAELEAERLEKERAQGDSDYTLVVPT
jgi:hypothetical protein